MKKSNYDCAVIGGGPAGLAAALKLHKLGVKRIALIERDVALGGILQQCIHDGFGIQRFGKRLSGGQYAQNFIEQLKDTDIDVKLNTTVIDINRDKIVTTISETEGMLELTCKTIIFGMGCRERTRNQVFIEGTRPSGILTAGAVQRYINIEGYLPGKKAVILGSGDIGLIMGRRMTLEGIKVEGVYEIMPTPGGLTRNIVQCLNDFDIPLHLSTTVVSVHGKDRLEGVTVAQVTPELKKIKGTEHFVSCDLLVLSVGLIPENELSRSLNLEMDSKTKGPIVDDYFMTSLPGVFVIGNAVAVFDLVDYVSETAEIAATGVHNYLNSLNFVSEETGYIDVVPGENINFIVPQKIHISQIDNFKPIFI